MARSNCPQDVPKLLPSQFLPSSPPMQLAQFTYSICNGILDSPIELGCGHTFCSKCCISLFQSGNPICPEPHCTSTSTITVDDIKKPLDLLINYKPRNTLMNFSYVCGELHIRKCTLKLYAQGSFKK